VLIVQLLQQHVIAIHCLANATLEVARLNMRHVFTCITGSGDNVEPYSQDFP
jgi:hypothetical protein